MKVEINDEIVDEIVLIGLEYFYDTEFVELQELIETGEIRGCYSYNEDEEIYALIRSLESINHCIVSYGGLDKKLDIELKELGIGLYESKKNFEEERKAKEYWIIKANKYKYDLDNLRSNLDSLLESKD